MAQKQLFPVFDLPEIPDTEELEERYSPSAYFDFEKGDFVRDGAGKIKKSEGKDAYIQWCLKVVSTERYSCLAYSSDIGVELDQVVEADRAAAESIIERTITEALMMHRATEYVRDFSFLYKADEVYVTFTVKGYPWEEEQLKTKITQ